MTAAFLGAAFLDDPLAVRMAKICVAGLGGFLLWAGLVPLQEGIAASGSVVVENRRQVVQHLEGGIIDTIRVREGQTVAAGTVLLTLRETASLAEQGKVVSSVAALEAKVARLSAIQDGLDAPNFAALAALGLTEAERADIARRELTLFREQRQALAAELGVIEARRRTALSVGSSRGAQAGIAQRSLSAAQDELSVMRRMADQQLARSDQVAALERGVTGVQSEMARLGGDRIEAQSQAADLASQAVQVRATFNREVALELVAARNELRVTKEPLLAARDVVDRNVIRAPVAGKILNMAVNTRAGVIRPGDPIMEIVPVDATVTASVRVRPSDRASVHEGQDVTTQVLAYRSWLSPRLKGKVIGLSADLKTDQANGQVFYEALVEVSDSGRGAIAVLPGMPVEVFVFSGRSRTTLDYLFEPILASLLRGLRSI